jgi:hypothetical protein
LNAKITAFRAERGKVGRDVWNGIPAVGYELEYGGGRFLRNVGTYLRKYMTYSGTVLCYYLSKLQRQGVSRKKVRCLSNSLMLRISISVNPIQQTRLAIDYLYYLRIQSLLVGK